MRVASFAEAPGYPWWWLLQVEGQQDGYLVYSNWVAANGKLQQGDEIELEEAKVPTYSNCEYAFVAALRRVKKEGEGVV